MTDHEYLEWLKEKIRFLEGGTNGEVTQDYKDFLVRYERVLKEQQ